MIILLAVGCEDRPNVSLTIEESYPPTFLVKDNGCYSMLMIAEISPENGCGSIIADSNKFLWSVDSNGSLRHTERERRVSYGQIPAGYIQKIPANSTPPTLVEGKLYGVYVVCPTLFGQSKLFIIRNGKTIEVQQGQCPPDVPNK